MDNTINFYSSGDEVVKNGSDKVNSLLSREYAWYNQDRVKGFVLVSLSPQAGWRFGNYFKEDVIGYNDGYPVYGTRLYTPQETTTISNECLRVCPFFRSFRDSEIYGEGGSEFVRTNNFVRWYALSHGIPSESFSAGANPVPKWNNDSGEDNETRNIDMAIECAPKGRKVEWVHSYFIDFSLFDTQILYEKIVQQIGTTTTEGGNQ